jgi:uncharacterized protein
MLAERITASQLAEMSARGARLSGSYRPADLRRLARVVASGVTGEPVVVAVGLSVGPEGLPLVRIQVQGALQLVCQRCLSPIRWPVDIDVSLTAVADDAQAAELADPFDSILLEEGALSLRSAVEDEILAVLPLSPVHADAAQCGVAGRDIGTDAGPRARPNRPFAGLAALMAQRDGGGEQD